MHHSFTSPLVLAAALLVCRGALAQQTPMPAPSSSTDNAAAMQASAPRDATLKPVFKDFGGKAGLVSLMDDLMANLMADPRTRPYFA
ncbi:MAG: group 1 truncated hemoglobin, partial [Xanthomonadales bacterium]|nr:group 1 truncated hemoglobin [Xanthomonadales bacterium]